MCESPADDSSRYCPEFEVSPLERYNSRSSAVIHPMLERFVRFADRFGNEIFLEPPRSVGKIRVSGVTIDESHHGFEVATLQLSAEPTDRRSRYIRCTSGSIAQGDVVEVLIRQIEPIPFLTNSAQLLDINARWLTAIRPYNPSTFQTPVDRKDTVIHEMFRVNRMGQDTAPAFYNRFLRERAMKTPPYQTP
jgi:hypothetical protein